MEKTKVLLKILENSCKSQLLCALSPLTTPTSWGPVRSQPWWSLLMGSQAKGLSQITRSRPLSDQMTMPACEKSFTDRYSRVMRDGLTPPDLIVIDGGQGQVNIAKQVIQEELGLDIPIAGLQRMTSTRPMNCSSVIPFKSSNSLGLHRNFSSCNGSKMEVHRFAITFHRQLRSKNSFSSSAGWHRRFGTKT